MIYRSVVEEIWDKLRLEGSARRPMTFRSGFDNICEVFYQAEYCPGDDSNRHIKMYRAEWNIHAYLFGEDAPFMGLDPAISNGQFASGNTPAVKPEATSPASALPPSLHDPRTPSPSKLAAASANRKMLKDALARRNRTHKPQLGWNPSTGEPWFAVRSYVVNAFPAIWGPHRSALSNIEQMQPDFALQFERFPHRGYTLLWPEFADQSSLGNNAAWVRFHRFRTFLAEWAALSGNVEMMDSCLRKFLARSESARLVLPVPDGFVLNQGWRDRSAALPASSGHTSGGSGGLGAGDSYRPVYKSREQRDRGLGGRSDYGRLKREEEWLDFEF